MTSTYRTPPSSLLIAAMLAIAVLIFAPSTQGQTAKVLTASNDVPARLNQQRQLYRQSLALIGSGNWLALRKQRQELVDYPLFPYLVYAELLANLNYSKRTAVTTYLAQYAGTVKATHLQGKWLDYLARRGYWETYVQVYNANSYIGNSSRQHHWKLASDFGAKESRNQKPATNYLVS
jgi:hypothetical protein